MTHNLLINVMILMSTFKAINGLALMQNGQLMVGENEPEMICFWPGLERNEPDLITRFRKKTTDHVLLVDGNCATNNTSREPLLLLCGGKFENTSTDLPCQCPPSNHLHISATDFKTDNQVQPTTNQLICSKYNEKNFDFATQMIPPFYNLNGHYKWNPLLILSRFYFQDNVMDLVHQLILHNSTNFDDKTIFRENSLMLLCQQSKSDKIVQLAELLIDKIGLGVNQTDIFGYTALHMLVFRNSQTSKITQVADLLIGKGIHLNQRDNHGHNALMMLCRASESQQIVQVAELLITKGTDLQCTNKFGFNALMLLCSQSPSDKIVEVAQLLIASGIDPNYANKYGDNALILTSQFSKNEHILQVAELLTAEGVHINHTNVDGCNALMTLCQKSRSNQIVQVAKLFIASGINIHQKDNEGDSALLLLCWDSENDQIVQVAQLLIENGANVNDTNNDGNNALMILCSQSPSDKIVQVAHLLITKGIDIHHRNKKGENALMLLVRQHNTKFAMLTNLVVNAGRNENQETDRMTQLTELLVGNGLNLDQKYNDEKTAIDYLTDLSPQDVPNKAQII